MLLSLALPAQIQTAQAQTVQMGQGVTALQAAAQAQGQGAAVPPPEPRTPFLVFNLSAGLTYDDNPDLTRPANGAGGRLDTGFGLALNRKTALSTLNLSLDGALRFGAGKGTGQGAGGQNGLRDPALKLGYKADTGNSRVSLDLTDARSAVDLFEPGTLPDGTLSATDLVAATGTVTHQQTSLGFETGIRQSLGFDLSGQYDGRAYSDTTSTSVYDSHLRSGEAGLHWRIDPANTLSLTAHASGTDYSNLTATRQRSHDLSLSFDRLLRPDLTLQASLGQGQASSSTLGVVTERSSGLIGSLGLTQKQAGGSASVTLGVSRDALGTRNQLSFGRSLTLPTGTLAATAGVSARSGGKAQFIGSLAYAQTLALDSFNVSLSRQTGLSSTTTDQTSTVLGLDWQHKVTETSRLGLSANISSISGTGVAGSSRQTLSASWSWDLVADWQLKAGYQYRALDSTTTAGGAGSSAGKVTSNSVFLTLSRKLTLLP
jgi:hypothetical protein